jgi:ubiquinone/menaquinone biosynthesis C-methylase UbiE
MDPLDLPSEWDFAFNDVYARTHSANYSPEVSERESLYFLRLAGVKPGDRILDCPCGFGRHAPVLKREGYSVVAVDRSVDQLAEARRRTTPQDMPEYIQGDYRALDFPDDSFDAVACLAMSLGFLDEKGDVLVLAEFKRLLRPGARLVLEVGHRDSYIYTFQQKTEIRLADGALYVKERHWDPRESRVYTTHTLVEESGETNTWKNAHRIRDIGTWEHMLRLAGFTSIDTRSGFSETPIAEDITHRAVFVASRVSQPHARHRL